MEKKIEWRFMLISKPSSYQEKKMKCKWIHEDGAKQGSPIMVYGGAFGEVFIKHVLASAIKKGGPLEEIKIVII